MGVIKPFEAFMPIRVVPSDAVFLLKELTYVNLTGEFSPDFTVGASITFDDPVGWNPDVFSFAKIGIVTFASTSPFEHVLFDAHADASNHIKIYKPATQQLIQCDYTYAGILYRASGTMSFASGTTIFVGVQMPGLGEKLTLWLDNDSDNVLESFQTANNVATAFPNVSNGLVNLSDTDTGHRFNVSGGITNIATGITNYIAIISRDGLFRLIEE